METDLTVPQSDFTLLPHKFRLFTGGYGSGKTHTMVANGMMDLLDTEYPGGDVALYAPTYDLLKLNLEPRIEEWLTEAGFKYGFNKTDHIITVQGHGRFICRSLDNPSRIIGYEVYRSHIDEIDTLVMGKADEVWKKVIARNRQKVKRKSAGGPRRYGLNRVSAYSTPEGFRFTYNRWGKAQHEHYGYVRASTLSNEANLPDDYVESLRESYPDQLVDAYIDGHWVNLTSGAVYPLFDRVLNGTKITEEKGEPLHVGMDFNVGKMAAVIHVIRDGLPYAIQEYINVYDTPTMVETLKEHHPGHRLIVYPDSSGKSRDTRGGASEGDISILKDAGFRVDAPNKNPAIKDRVLSMNAMLCNMDGDRRYRVNVDRCPEYTLALEQQIWDQATGLPDKKHDLDHPTDAAGYFIHRRYPIKRRTFRTARVVGV